VSKLIDELREDHTRIRASLDEIEAMCLAGKDVQEKVRSIEHHLVEHLKKEDELLYPRLREHMHGRKELKRLLDSLPGNMDYITRLAEEFFSRHPSAETSPEFKMELESLIENIRNRILNEENFFFMEYEILFD